MICKFERKYTDKQIKSYAEYMIKKKCTVADAAKKFKIPKSSMYTCLRTHLWKIDKELWVVVSEIIASNTIDNMNRIKDRAKNKLVQEKTKTKKKLFGIFGK